MYAVTIQAFAKVEETIRTIQSFNNCYNSNRFDLFVWVDKAEAGTKYAENNTKLLTELDKLEAFNNFKFKSFNIVKSEKPRGPYKGCACAIDHCFSLGADFVIFSEDDQLITRDGLEMYKWYADSKEQKDELAKKCLGISSFSVHYGAKGSLTQKETVEQRALYLECPNAKKNQYAIEKVHWAPNKQFGMFENQWNIVRRFRADESSYNPISAPDTETGSFVKNNSYYFVYSYIPRCNDIGLEHALGWTMQFCKEAISTDETRKFITSDDFDTPLNGLKLMDLFHLI